MHKVVHSYVCDSAFVNRIFGWSSIVTISVYECPNIVEGPTLSQEFQSHWNGRAVGSFSTSSISSIITLAKSQIGYREVCILTDVDWDVVILSCRQGFDTKGNCDEPQMRARIKASGGVCRVTGSAKIGSANLGWSFLLIPMIELKARSSVVNNWYRTSGRPISTLARTCRIKV